MIYRRQPEIFQRHQHRREEIRSLKGDFQPSKEELEKARQHFFQRGGRVTTLKVTSETKPGVWGDFVKSRIKAG